MRRISVIISFLLLSVLGLHSQEKRIYVQIDSAYNELYRLIKEDHELKRLQVLKYNKRELGFDKKEYDKDNPKEVIIFSSKYLLPNYYEFYTVGVPTELPNCDDYKTYTIEDISKNNDPMTRVWSNHDVLVILKKEKCICTLWEMAPVFIE